VAHALKRELHEELGIDIGSVHPWVVRVFDYPHALVRLHFCRVFDWSGELHAREQQRFGFFALDALPAPLLPATVPVLRGLELPSVYGVSAAGLLGIDAFLRRLGDSLARGLRLVQLREPDLSTADVDRLFGEMHAMTRSAGARLLVNSRHPRSLWEAADGVHLTSHALATIGERPAHRWVGASVHDEKELALAGELGLDFAVLGPVQVTASHPGQSPLGWTKFGRIAVGTSLPVYAIADSTVQRFRWRRRAARTASRCCRQRGAPVSASTGRRPSVASRPLLPPRRREPSSDPRPTRRDRSSCSARSRTAGTSKLRSIRPADRRSDTSPPEASSRAKT